MTEPGDDPAGMYLSRSGGPTADWNSPGGTWGVYRYGSAQSDRFCVGVTGVNEPFCISTAGNVGIGTTSPGGSGTINLQIAGGSAGDNPAGLRLSNPAAGITSNLGVVDFNNGATILGRISVAADGTADSGKIRLQTATGGALGTGVVIDRTGNVGIGTASPAARLEVNTWTGTAPPGFNPIIKVAGGMAGGNTQGHTVDFHVNTTANNPSSQMVHTMSDGSGGEIQFRTTANYATTAPTPRLTINSSGNVGIGTTGPNHRLEVSGGSIALDHPGNVGNSRYIGQEGSTNVWGTQGSGAGGSGIVIIRYPLSQ